MLKLSPSWQLNLLGEFSKKYWTELTDEVRYQYLKEPVYPHPRNLFRALDLVTFENVKVVIIGQDPYHGKGQANGLCFSVNEGILIPPSLQNIYKEIHNDLGFDPQESGDLSRWATQGVLLLNSVLTVRANKPASHSGLGWEKFTDRIVQELNKNREGVVFILWGRYAQTKGYFIDTRKHLVLKSAHPSPFSATKFFNNHHFSRCNKFLEEKGQTPIDWH